MDIPGTRGYIGKNTVNASTYADAHIEFQGDLTMEKVVKEPTKPVFNESLFEL
jgi:hypothetical protein